MSSKEQTAELDPGFKYEVAAHPGAENIRKCFSCGTCTGACPVFRVEEGYNPRRIIRMVLLGMREEVLSSKMIWLCARCYACTVHCPQDVSFADIMVVLRDMAIKEGHAEPEILDQIDRITVATHEFRKDCIQKLTKAAEEEVDIVEKMREMVKEIEELA
ncbi:MAG: 4Fe-4S dicluster domain-containing protein [Lentisphaerae bacterium]|nr:4Fe-4S dicluster domain-containing protein [Lentisphaerota bacterium]